MLSNRIDLTDRIAIEYGVSAGQTFKETERRYTKVRQVFQEKLKPTDSSFTGTSFLVTIAVIPVIAEKSIDLRRKAAYKKRHKPRPKSEKQQQYRIGRDYDEFQRFMLYKTIQYFQ